MEPMGIDYEHPFSLRSVASLRMAPSKLEEANTSVVFC